MKDLGVSPGRVESSVPGYSPPFPHKVLVDDVAFQLQKCLPQCLVGIKVKILLNNRFLSTYSCISAQLIEQQHQVIGLVIVLRPAMATGKDSRRQRQQADGGGVGCCFIGRDALL